MSGWAYSSVLRSWICCRIIFRIVLFICLCMQENLLNIYTVQYQKDLLICFLVKNHFKFHRFNNSSCLITDSFKNINSLKQKCFFCYPSNPNKLLDFLSKNRFDKRILLVLSKNVLKANKNFRFFRWNFLK